MSLMKSPFSNLSLQLMCCGVNNVTDWKGPSFNFPKGMNKPDGCCQVGRSGDLSKEQKEVSPGLGLKVFYCHLYVSGVPQEQGWTG